jgi:type II secretory pathway pseudopilin PulG
VTFDLEIRSSKRGAVLLEVVLALTLFAAAAAVIGAAVHAAITGIERQKLEAHAANLAITVLSEIQMGVRTVESLGPDTFESPFEEWSWQLVLTGTENEAGESSDLTRVEVVVRHDEPVFVHRLTQVLKLPKKPQISAGGTSLPGGSAQP